MLCLSELPYLETLIYVIYHICLVFVQALFVFLLLPLLSNLRGIKLAELSGHLNGGAECFLNVRESPIGNVYVLMVFSVLIKLTADCSLY